MNKVTTLILISISFLMVSCNGAQNPEEATTAIDTQQEQSITQNTEENTQAVVGNFSDFAAKIPDVLKNDQNFLTCSASSIDSCISESALSEGNAISCDDYLLSENRINCEEGKVTMQAKNENNAGLCDTLTSNKDSCLYEVALTQGMESFDTSVCDTIADYNKIQCNNDIVMAEAKEKQDIKICSEILLYNEGDTYEKTFCEEEVGYYIEEQKRIAEFESEQQELEGEQELEGQETSSQEG